MKKIIKILMVLLARIFYRFDKHSILFLDFSENSGSNITPLLEKIEQGYLKNIKVKVIRKPSSSQKFIERLFWYWDVLKWITKSRCVVTTHGLPISSNIAFLVKRKKTIHIELWHGAPLKAMNLMDRTDPFASKKLFSSIDIFCSYSEFANVLFNACFALSIDKYRVTGAPRNDFLFFPKARELLEKVTGMKLKDSRVIFYCPTFRVGHGNRREGKKTYENIFDFPDFDLVRFNDFLERENLFFFVKCHMLEEKFVLENLKKFQTTRIHVISSEILKTYDIDFYKLLGSGDLLITDYSSIFFDWLLLDKPVIFTPVDLEEYRKIRGFLLEPYEFWTPGPKCFDQESLEREILKCLSDPGYYRKEREILRDIFHKYKDGKSSERVLELIREILEG